MPTIVARRYDSLAPVTLEIGGERVVRIDAAPEKPDLPLVAPGFVDLQINGFGGIEFNDPELTVEKV